MPAIQWSPAICCSRLFDYPQVFDDPKVFDDSQVFDDPQLFDDPKLFDDELEVWILIIQKSTVIHPSVMVLYITETVEIRWNCRCKSFGLKIRQCKILDKTHVWWNDLHKGEVLRSLAKISKQNQHILQLLDITTSDPVCITIAGDSFVHCLGGRQVIVFPLSFRPLIIMSGEILCSCMSLQ